MDQAYAYRTKKSEEAIDLRFHRFSSQEKKENVFALDLDEAIKDAMDKKREKHRQWHRRLSSVLDEASKISTTLEAKTDPEAMEKIKIKDQSLDFTFYGA